MDATAANRELVERFVDLFYRRRQVREAFETCVSATHYIQHNPNMPDGREAAITMLEPKFSAPGFQADIQRVLVDGEFAVVHLHARAEPGARGAAVADIFRIEGGQIVEHWDVLQPVPEQALSAHPMF